MGMPPTLDSTIADLERAVECRLTLSNGTIVAGPGLVNFAAFQLKKLRDDLRAAIAAAQAEQSASVPTNAQDAEVPEVRAAEPVTGTPGSVVWGVFQSVVQADGWFDALNKSVEANTFEEVNND